MSTPEVTVRPDGAIWKERRARVASMVERLPEGEVIAQGDHLSLEVRGRRFGWYLENHHGDGRLALHCKSSPELRQHLSETMEDAFHVPSHVGHHGWIGLWLDSASVDWDVVDLVLREAYRAKAPKTLLSREQQQ